MGRRHVRLPPRRRARGAAGAGEARACLRASRSPSPYIDRCSSFARLAGALETRERVLRPNTRVVGGAPLHLTTDFSARHTYNRGE